MWGGDHRVWVLMRLGTGVVFCCQEHVCRLPGYGSAFSLTGTCQKLSAIFPSPLQPNVRFRCLICCIRPSWALLTCAVPCCLLEDVRMDSCLSWARFRAGIARDCRLAHRHSCELQPCMPAAIPAACPSRVVCSGWLARRCRQRLSEAPGGHKVHRWWPRRSAPAWGAFLRCSLQLNNVFWSRELRVPAKEEKEALEHGEARTESVGDRNTPEITMTMDGRRLRSGPCKADRLSTRSCRRRQEHTGGPEITPVGSRSACSRMRSNLIACTADEKRPGAVGLNQLAWLSTARGEAWSSQNYVIYILS